MTAITPMTSPVTVSSERTLFPKMTLSASSKCIIAAASRAQRLDRIHICRPPRGVHPEEHSNGARKRNRDGDDQHVRYNDRPDRFADEFGPADGDQQPQQH